MAIRFIHKFVIRILLGLLIPALFWVITCGKVSAQKVRVEDISIEGLRRTRSYILERELSFKKGDSIDLKDITTLFAFNEKRLLNTNLVVEAKFNITQLDLDGSKVFIGIRAREGLYLYPAPLLEFLDNDFNKWWRNYNRSFKTLSYGLYAKHINLTGNGDEITVYGQAGFTRKVSLEYEYPYLNRSNTIGVGITAFYAANKEVAFKTSGNYLQFRRDFDDDLLQRVKYGLRFAYRPGIYSRHYLLVNFYHFRASDSLAYFYNENFFNGKKRLDFPEFEYAFRFDNRDIIPYAMKGWDVLTYLNKTGLKKDDLHVLFLGLQASKYQSYNDRLSSESQVFLRYNLDRGKVPYYFNKAIGYDDIFARGYEYFVIDGQDYFLIKNHLRFLFFDRSFDLGRAMILRAYRVMPVKVFLTAGIDVARVQDNYYYEDNYLSNKFQTGYGLGLDFLFYYNKLLRFEVSRNNHGMTGFYIHFDAGL